MKVNFRIIFLLSFFIISNSVFAEGYFVTSDLWIRAVINTVEKGPIDAIWQKGGEDTTSRGDTVIWGHFYANPADVSWGSPNNPDLFVKIWFDVSGRVDVNYFHVSVPDIVVSSDYVFDGIVDEQGTTTLSKRYIRQFYENDQSSADVSFEDGVPPSGFFPSGNPFGYSTIDDLRIGSIINSVEKGPINGIWVYGGQDTTSRGDQVVWGYFYANPADVAWGSQDNPDLFAKIWFDISGRIDVNFFHVSVPDIEVYSDLDNDGTYEQHGTTILSNRYIRNEYSGSNDSFNFDGTWTGTAKGTVPDPFGNPCATATFSFNVVGTQIKGSALGGRGEQFILSGDVTQEGKATIGLASGSEETVAIFTGIFSGNTVNGQWVIPENGCRGTWTGTRN